jgi:hypothetical protein
MKARGVSALIARRLEELLAYIAPVIPATLVWKCENRANVASRAGGYIRWLNQVVVTHF